MSRTTTLPRVVATAATGLAVLAAGVAAPVGAAATERRGTTTVAPSETTRSVLQAVLKPARLDASGAVFPVTNARGGRVSHVGGLQLAESNAATPATSLTLRNFIVDTRAGTVSAIVDDTSRATVFTLASGGTLLFTQAASRALTGGDGLTGVSAGTATVRLG